MIEIRRIRFAPNEWAVAKQLIYRVAHAIFNDPRPLEEAIAYHEARNELKDLDDIQASYFDNGGIFLVTTKNGEIIGTGAIRKLEDDICELKRVWLLIEYHGQGLGYRMMQELLAFARAHGYKYMRLETDPVNQRQAHTFYERLGFHEIPYINPQPDEEDIMMEMAL